MSEPVFLAGQASRITGVPHRTIDYWAKSGLVKPTIQDASGTGTDRIYNFRDLVILRLVLEMRKAGVNTVMIKAAILLIRQLHEIPTERWLLLVDSHCFLRADDGGLIRALNARWQNRFYQVFDFRRIVSGISELVEMLAA